jgi:hypothetical protein
MPPPPRWFSAPVDIRTRRVVPDPAEVLPPGWLRVIALVFWWGTYLAALTTVFAVSMLIMAWMVSAACGYVFLG